MNMMIGQQRIRETKYYDVIKAVAKRVPLRDGMLIANMLEKHKNEHLGSDKANTLLTLCLRILDEVEPEEEEE